MSPRSIRRAAERKAAKEARKAERLAVITQGSTDDREASSAHVPTPTRAEINRANAEKSTGPRTEEGKNRVRYNAVRHNLTGRTILLPTDDIAFYENHCRSFQEDLKPMGHREELLVQAIADHNWRLTRIASLESAVFATGERELADELQGEDPAVIQLTVMRKYEKDLRNLHIQESRLTRYIKNDMAELKSLQAAREQEEKEQLEAAAALAAQAKAAGQTFNPAEFGFVFSTREIEAFLEAKGNLKLAKRLAKIAANYPRTLAQAA